MNLKNLMPKRNWFRVWSLSNYKFDQAYWIEYIERNAIFLYGSKSHIFLERIFN